MRWTEIAIPVALLTGGAIAQPGLVIDDFDSLSNDEIGGMRQISLDVLANPFGQQTNFDVVPGFSFGGNVGALVFNSGLGVQQTGTIGWSGEGGLNLDFSELLGLEFDFLQVDQDFQIAIELASNGVEGTANWMGTVFGSPTQQSVLMGFGDFASNEGFDLSDLDAITVRFNTGPSPTSSLDFVLSDFSATVIPAPGSAVLLGLTGLVATRRRR